MGLLDKLNNGDTSLKSLEYGHDQPGGGSSKQPYIKRPIDLEIKNPAYYNEFIVRGGLEAPLSAAEDVVRLTKYFFDLRNPSGLLFIAKQNILSRVAVKTEASSGLAYKGINEGIYTPLSTLAQAGIGWAGGHVNKQGLDPTGLFPFLSIKKYVDVVYDNNRKERNEMDPKVPDNLYRKAERATSKVAREREKLTEQTQEYLNELNDPANSVSFPSSNPDSAGRSRSLQRAENAVNNFLEKWDAYRDKAELKKLSRQGDDTQRAIDRAASIDQQIEKAENTYRYSNRLLKLWNETGLNKNNDDNFGKDTGNILYTYSGGPDSVLGIGKTKIYFATSNDGITPERTNQAPGGQSVPPPIYNMINIFKDKDSSASLRYAAGKGELVSDFDLFGADDFLKNYDKTPNFQSFEPSIYGKQQWATWRSFTRAVSSYGFDGFDKSFTQNTGEYLSPYQYSYILSASPNYEDKNIEDNFNLGNPGKRGDISSYTRGKRDLYSVSRNELGPVDKINSSLIYKSPNSLGSRYPGVNGGKNQDPALKDIIPFYIAILNNEDQPGGPFKKYIHFRAFIDEISDSYDADWNTVEYMGRAEKFYKYGGFSRKMSLAFKVVAQSREELKIMYDKLNFLASSLAPEYLDATTTGYMAGNIAYITLGGYLNDQPGVITTLDYNIPEDSPWEIGIGDDGEPITDKNDIRQLPHMIDVKLNFIPIQKFRPQKSVFQEDTPGTTSTRLLGAGYNQYIDQLKPPLKNYDKQITTTSKTVSPTAVTSPAPVQTAQQQDQLLPAPTGPIDPDVALGDQSALVTGVDTSNSVFNNTIFQ